MFPPTNDIMTPEVQGQLIPEGMPPGPSPEEIQAQQDELEAQQEAAKAAEEEFQRKLADIIKTIVREYEVKDSGVRERMVRFWRKCELFWEGIQNIIWDGQDYRSAAEVISTLGENSNDFDPYYYDKIVNIYRAYGESVVAALSQEVPSVIFPPDDADSMLDLRTSEAYSKISGLVAKHNQSPIIWMKALFILWNQGMVGGYTYTKTDSKYGTYKTDKIENQKEEMTIGHMCPQCGGNLESISSPDESIDGMESTGGLMCAACEMEIPQEQAVPQTTTIEVPKIVGQDDNPKSREIIDIYGPLEVFIPHYVRKQESIPIAVLKTDIHYTLAQEKFPLIADKIAPAVDEEPYGRWSRSYPEGYGEDDSDLTTVRQCWLRPWVFNKIQTNDKDFYDQIRSRYPKGISCFIVNNNITDIEEEDMDECWTFSINPLSSHLHAKPLGAALIPIQEIRNELVLLKLQTVEYGIPETFAEAGAINWAAYKNNPARPGMLYPAKAQAGQGLDGSFTTLKTSVFPKESIEFQEELDSDAQFVTGAFPSVFGGPLSSGGKTAAEYSMSQNRALQRLSITNKFLSWWWAFIMGKSVRHFHQNILKIGQDQSFAIKDGSNWKSIWIRREELEGKVGECEPELADSFPMSWAQRRDLIFQLIQYGNEDINAALFNPENTSLISQYAGFPNLYIPGEDDRVKQLGEIQILIQSEPVDMEGMQPTVPIDPIMDNSEAEFKACQVWMKSDRGLDAKINNPAGFANVRAHALQHFMVIQQNLQAQAEQEQQGNNPADKNKPEPPPSGNE